MVVALIFCIFSGTILPLMDIVFGRFVNVFNDFLAGTLSPAGYRAQVDYYRYAVLTCGSDCFP